jgi:hypothetical protein
MDYMNYGMGFGGFGPFVLLALAWTFLWKGLALWRSAKRSDMWWFIAFLFINTLGILEIIYLFAVTGAKLSDFTKPLTHNGHNH